MARHVIFPQSSAQSSSCSVECNNKHNYTMSWETEGEDSPRLIDLLREYIPRPPVIMDINSIPQPAIAEDDAWLSLAPDHRNHVKRWKDFNYPVIRVALRDFLDYPVSLRTTRNLDDWPNSIGGIKEPADRPPPVHLGSLLTLGHQLNEALYHGVVQLRDEEDDDLEPTLYLRIGHSERIKDPASGRECTLQYDWALHVSDYGHEEEQPVVVGVNKSAEEFPLWLNLDENGQLISAETEWALRQVGTACWYKGTPYAFILTPEGAVLLLFGKAPQMKGNDGRTDQVPYLDVRYAIIHWDHDDTNILEIPLVMSLWALCMIAWCDDDRASWTGSAVRLNTWREVIEKGKKIHTHLLLPQDNKGHPPGAKVIRAMGIHEVLERARIFEFRMWLPSEAVESPVDLSSAGTSSSTISPVIDDNPETMGPLQGRESVCGTTHNSHLHSLATSWPVAPPRVPGEYSQSMGLSSNFTPARTAVPANSPEVSSEVAEKAKKVSRLMKTETLIDTLIEAISDEQKASVDPHT
ncbi:hypothetical protein BJ170DRAFT_610250 [Xylariales sp. AK1849]|nr:hypothetical protein BJ170DRAFT_610250 [Xylariales sp. AK1849]